MTLGTTHASVRYDGDGATRDFAVTFEFHDAGDLEVIVVTVATGVESAKALGADYSVEGGDGGTGTVTMNIALDPTERLVVRRVSPDQQPDDLQDGGPLAAESLERRLDILAARLQELEMEIGRSLKVAKGSLATDEDLTLNLTGGVGQGVLVAKDEQGVILGAGATLDDVVVSTKGEELVSLADESAMRSFLGLGTAATANIGTSGASIPLLNGNNIYSGFASFTGGAQFVNNDPQIVSTDDSRSDAPNFVLYRNSASPENNDAIGRFLLRGKNKAGQVIAYTTLRSIIENADAGHEEGRFEITSYHQGESRVRWRINRGIYSPDALGQDRGQGTVNVDGGVYKNSVEYTQGWRYGDNKASAGTAIQLLSGLPDDVQEIEIFFTGVSTNTNSQSLIIRLKDSGAISTSGYISHSTYQQPGGTSVYNTNGCHLTTNAIAASQAFSGIMRLSLRDPSGQHWFFTGDCGVDGTLIWLRSSGRKALSDALREVWLTTPGGTAVFDAGSIRARYRQ